MNSYSWCILLVINKDIFIWRGSDISPLPEIEILYISRSKMYSVFQFQFMHAMLIDYFEHTE